MSILTKRKSQVTVCFDEFTEYVKRQRTIEAETGEKKTRRRLFCYSNRFSDAFQMLRARIPMTLTMSVLLVLASCMIQNYLLTIALIGLVLIWVETIYLCVWNEGRDFFWFSGTCFTSMIMFMAMFWTTLETRNQMGSVECHDTNTTSYELNKCLGFHVDICQLIYLQTAILLVSIVMGKSLTPYSKKLNLKTHANMTAVFISTAADFYDLIDYHNFSAITDIIGTSPILIVGYLSLIQFSFNLAATKGMRLTISHWTEFFVDFLFSTEAWALLLVFLTQDMPSLILRIYILAKCGFFVHPSLYFFGLKNLLMGVSQLFRCGILFFEYKDCVVLSSSFWFGFQRSKQNQVQPAIDDEEFQKKIAEKL